RRCWTMKHLDAVFRQIGARNCSSQHLDEITLCIFVLSEDKNAQVGPFSITSSTPFTRQTCGWAHVFAHPINEKSHPRIHYIASMFGSKGHFIKQGLFALDVR